MKGPIRIQNENNIYEGVSSESVTVNNSIIINHQKGLRSYRTNNNS